MADDEANALGGSANGGDGSTPGSVALLSDPVDVIIAKLLRYAISTVRLLHSRCAALC